MTLSLASWLDVHFLCPVFMTVFLFLLASLSLTTKRLKKSREVFCLSYRDVYLLKCLSLLTDENDSYAASSSLRSKWFVSTASSGIKCLFLICLCFESHDPALQQHSPMSTGMLYNNSYCCFLMNRQKTIQKTNKVTMKKENRESNKDYTAIE